MPTMPATVNSRSARTLLCAAVLVSCLSWAANARASDDQPVEWNASWHKVGLLEGLALIPMAGAMLAIESVWKPAQHPRWRGGIFIDSNVREAFVGESYATQHTARQVGDKLYMIGSIVPIIADVAVAWAVHGKSDIALQILLIDLQSAALAGLVSLTSEHAVGRGRPFSADCNADGDVLDANGRPLANHCGSGYEAKSFFSGHSAATMTSAGLTCLTHERMSLFGGGARDVAPCVLMVGVSLATGVSRLVADMHWFSDVVIGWSVGAVAGYVLPAALHYGFSNDPKRGGSLTLVPLATANGDRVEVGVLGVF